MTAFVRYSAVLKNKFPLDKQIAMLGELIILLSEILLIGLSWQKKIYGILLSLLLDILILSPLKAGRSLLYDTLVIDPKSARFSLLLRYYRYGYFKTVCWRALLWGRIASATVVLSILPFSVRFFLKKFLLESAIITTGFELLFYFSLTIVLILISLVAVADSPASYLLLYSDSAKTAFKLKKRIFRKQITPLLQAYWNLLQRLPLLLMIVPLPYFLIEFRIKQTREIRQQIDVFLEKKLM